MSADATGNSGTQTAIDAAPSPAVLDLEALTRLVAHLDELKVPTEIEGRLLPIDERVQLLVLHFRTQYQRLDRGVASLANAIDSARRLLGDGVITFKKAERARTVLQIAAKAITVRGA